MGSHWMPSIPNWKKGNFYTNISMKYSCKRIFSQIHFNMLQCYVVCWLGTDNQRCKFKPFGDASAF